MTNRHIGQYCVFRKRAAFYVLHSRSSTAPGKAKMPVSKNLHSGLGESSRGCIGVFQPQCYRTGAELGNERDLTSGCVALEGWLVENEARAADMA